MGPHSRATGASGRVVREVRCVLHDLAQSFPPNRTSASRVQQGAADLAEQLRLVFAELADLSANQAAAKLNERGMRTAAGGRWHAAQVIRVRER